MVDVPGCQWRCHGKVCIAGGGNFNCPIPGPKSAAPEDNVVAGFEDDLSRTIVDCEVNSSAWTLMHRYNKATELLDSVLNVSFLKHAIPCSGNMEQAVYNLVMLCMCWSLARHSMPCNYSRVVLQAYLYSLLTPQVSSPRHAVVATASYISNCCEKSHSSILKQHQDQLAAQCDGNRVWTAACRGVQMRLREQWPPSLCGCATAQPATSLGSATTTRSHASWARHRPSSPTRLLR